MLARLCCRTRAIAPVILEKVLRIIAESIADSRGVYRDNDVRQQAQFPICWMDDFLPILRTDSPPIKAGEAEGCEAMPCSWSDNSVTPGRLHRFSREVAFEPLAR
jgi:hypothetical protein